VFTIGYLRNGHPQLAHAMFNKSYQANIRPPFATWDEAGHQKTANGSHNMSDDCGSAESLRIRHACKCGLKGGMCGATHFVTGPGGFLQAITHGYGGASLGDDALTLRPSLPDNADQLKLRHFAYLGVWLSLKVDTSGIVLEALLDENTDRTRDLRLARLAVAAGGGPTKALVPRQPLRFSAGAKLTVRASA
jgi:hypothetical protein